MREKKIRGIKRKFKQMIERIDEYAEEFPTEEFQNGYWHLHLPVAQDFIDSCKTPKKKSDDCAFKHYWIGLNI